MSHTYTTNYLVLSQSTNANLKYLKETTTKSLSQDVAISSSYCLQLHEDDVISLWAAWQR